MTNYLTLKQYQSFTAKQTTPIEYIDILVPTLSGNFRGKRIPAAQINKLIQGEINLPLSISSMDVAGENPTTLKEGSSDGDPDAAYLPIKESLAITPWAQNRAQLIAIVNDKDPLANQYQNPRSILKNAIKLLENDGLYPQAAIELEFFLINPRRNKDGSVKPPKTLTNQRNITTAQCLNMQTLEEFEPFINQLQTTLKQQNLNPQAISAEYSQAQFEINQIHSNNLLKICDDAMLAKHTIKAIARLHKCEATFMAKPYLNYPGSGTHIHLSLYNEKNQNIFAQNQNILNQAIAGLIHCNPELFILCAPYANSYRRFTTQAFAPMQNTWGKNNRSTAIRIPNSKDNQQTRIEHRLAGADTCPYLIMTQILIAIHYGLNNPCQMINETNQDSIHENKKLPLRWGEALYAFKNSKITEKYLGKQTHQFLYNYLAAEYDAYHNHIPRQDFNRYIEC